MTGRASSPASRAGTGVPGVLSEDSDASTTSISDACAILGGCSVLGEYWHEDRSERTGIGELVHRAKDHADAEAADELAGLFAVMAGGLGVPVGIGAGAGGSRGSGHSTGEPRLPAPGHSATPARLVAAVPSASTDDAPHFQLSSVLARRLGDEGVGVYVPDLLVRGSRTFRVRDVPPALRPAAVAKVGYEVAFDVAGCTVILVDDVILTGSTIRAVSALLGAAGAAGVVAVVAARTRCVVPGIAV